ncbi:MAG: hypothetical protein SF339_11000 [Blastocatellia bacterium]|nr:hypothetical protein [Blastocatellia bacterium]
MYQGSTRFLAVICLVILALTSIEAGAQTTRKSKSSTVKRRAAAKPAAPTIPRGTEMKIRLEDEIDTKSANDGDKFRAVILTPSKYADATVEGHIAKINQSGKLKGKTEISLSFDTVRLKTGETIPTAAQVVKVYGEDSVKEVDEEGNVKSGSKGTTTAVRTGGGAALGAIVGGIAGGGKGAAIGAAIGAGVGAGSTYIQGSSKVKLERGTEILIKTTK